MLRVGEHQDDLRLDREVRERPVERMGQLVLHDRNGGDFVLAYVIEFHHGLERGLQLIRLRGRRAREIVRVDANRAQGVVTGGCREGARRGLRPERASRGNHPLKHRHVVGHDVTERDGHRGQRQLQRRHQLLGVDSTHVTHRGFLSWQRTAIITNVRRGGQLGSRRARPARQGLSREERGDTAAEMLIIFGDNPDRIHSEAAFAKLCGACPIPASSGMTTGRHRLYRGGHRQANAALHRAVIVRMRYHSPTLNYVERRTAEGRPKREIIRCLKRFLAREIFQRVMADYRARQAADLAA